MGQSLPKGLLRNALGSSSAWVPEASWILDRKAKAPCEFVGEHVFGMLL